MSSKLYEEALTDAKKIREVAEENAKKVILESVTPKIREFIESQILEKNDQEDKEDKEDKENDDSKDEMVELDESAINTLLDMIGSGQGQDHELSYALNEAVNKLSKSERQKLSKITKKINTNVETLKGNDLYTINEEKMMPNKEKFYEIDLNTLRSALNEDYNYLMEEDEDMEMEDMPPEEDDELIADAPEGDEEDAGDMISKDDIEAQIEELIADLNLDIGGGVEGGDMEMEEPDLDLDLDMGDEEEMEMEEEPLEEVFEVDPRMLQNELRRIRNRVNEAKGQGLAHQSGGIPKDYEHLFGGKGSANAKGGDFGGGKPGKDVLAEMRYALRNQRRQNTSLQTKLTKYRSAVNTLREQLEELNLFNAKLLYVNKLLQNKTISESQKRSIVQALDEAKDLREAKVLYKSLTESFGQSKSSKRGSLTESTRLGGSSRTTRSASSTQASSEVNRWARLAGLK